MAGSVLALMLVLFLLHRMGIHFGFRGGKRGVRLHRRRSSTPSEASSPAAASDGRSHQPEWMHLFNMCCHAYLYMLNFSYMLITKRALMFIDCEWRPEEQKYYLESDLRIECWNAAAYDASGERLCYDWSAFLRGDLSLRLGEASQPVESRLYPV